MPRFTYPGVYLREQAGGPSPVIGASASTLAIVGFTPEGPVDEPTLVLGFPAYESQFGGFTADSTMATQASRFFQNGGQQLVVVRTVAADATKGVGYLTEAESGEAVAPTPAFDAAEVFFTFTGANALAKTPVEPGTAAITTSAGVGSENFTDNGDGTLTGSAAGTGTINYDTGEMTLTYNAAPAVGLTVSVDYTYRTFSFTMKWEGATGNEFRVVVQGDPLYQDQATSSFSRFSISVERESSNGAGDFSTLETFSGVVMNDATSSDFLPGVINDENAGSRFVAAAALGQSENPSSLAGTQVTAEALTESPAYDGSEKAFTYTLANEASPNSISASFALAENGVSVGTAIAGTAQTAQLESGSIADTAALTITVAGVSTETFTLTTPGDGTGALTGDAGGSGTVDLATGVVNPLTMNGAAASGEAITASFNYLPHVVTDDGNGNLSITSTTGPSNWSLDANGTNSVDYDGAGTAAVMTLTWRDGDNPAAGPGTGAVTVTQTVDYYTAAAATVSNVDMTGGTDGSALTRADISSPTLVTNGEGIFAMDKTDALLQAVIPDFQTDQVVSQDLIDYVETRKDRFAIVWVPASLSPNEAVNYKKNKLAKNASNRAAIYYPHATIIDPVTQKGTNVPDGGGVAGIYARTDSNRNVAKAPAGVTDGAIRGATGLERTLSLAEVGLLNENNINCLVQFDFTGRVIWGARTLQGFAGEYPYLQMRRLFMFVEKAVFDSTQIYVFESNTPALRAKIKSQIDSFLLTLYNSNHFAGSTPADAFFVEDITNDVDVASGIVRFNIGLAPARPAEFIEFVFQQKTIENA